MANRIQLRRGTSTEWIQFNPVLAEAELGVEIDTGRIKIGDGATAWQNLKYERPLESVDATPNTLVLRDSTSSIRARNITLSTGGKLFGTATAADRFSTSRLIGAASDSDLTGSASFDGSSNLDINFKLKEIFTGNTNITYTKINVDSKGRITSAQNPTTLEGYGIIDAQPLNGVLTSISSVGTGLGFLVKVNTNINSANNTILRSLEVESNQLTITNASGTAGNPTLGLANTSVVAGTYNTESLTSVPGTSTVNSTKFTVDVFGRITSASTVPIATASETQKGLASFDSEDFDVSAAGVVTIAAQGVDNDQLQNPKIVIGTTDYVLGQTYTGFTTISDLTVDTNTLHVDKVNRRVGIGTATPGNFKLDIDGTVRTSGVITSTVAGIREVPGSAATGSAPFTVQSTRKVINLNAEFLDDLDSLDFLRRTNDLTNANNAGNQYLATNFWIDATNVTIQDPIIDIGAGSKGVNLTSNDAKDRGITLNYFDTASRKAFFGWDVSDSKFILTRLSTVTSEVISGTYAPLDLGATTLRNGSLLIRTGGTNAGTTSASGETTTFSVDHSTGNVLTLGTLDVTQNLRVNTDKFVVQSSSGNTSVAGSLTVTGQTQLNNTLGITGVTSITNETDSTSTNNGSLVVSGGVGIAKQLRVLGNTTLTGNLTSNSDVTLGDASTDNLVVNSTSTFNAPVTISGSNTLSVGGDITVTGNLVVNGTTTTVNSTTLTIDDPIITLGGDTVPTTDDNKDRGIEFRYFDTQARLGFFGWDEDYVTLTGSTGGYRFLHNATNTSEVYSGTDSGVIAGNIALTSNVGSTSITTGTLVVTGGTGISQNLWVGGTANVAGAVTLQSTLSVTNDVTLNRNVTIVGSSTPATELFRIQSTAGSNTFTVDSANGNTSISGTLSVTNDVTLNRNVTIVGSDTASTELFRIQNGSGTNRFTVDSSSGNTDISGNLVVTGNITGNGNTTLGDASTDSLTVNATSTFNAPVTISGSNALSVGGTLTVTNDVTLNRNVTIVGSDTVSTELFRIQNASGTNRFTVDSANGNTSISGTLDVTGNTSLSGTLTVTNLSTFNNGVLISGSTTPSSELFRITDGSADRFVVDTATGNTDLTGQLVITNNTDSTSTTTGSFRTSGGAYIARQLRVGQASTFGGNVNITGTLSATGDFSIATNKFTVASSTGNTSVDGTLAVTGLITANAGITLVGSAAAGEDFTITNGTSTRFSVESSTGNTSIVGTLGVTGTATLSSALSVTGSATVGGLLNANGGIAVVTNRFTVDSATGNTSIAGTLTVTGNNTLTGNISVNGGSVTTTATTFNLIDANATTVNFARASTALTIGATTGTTTIRTANVVLDGDLQVRGGDITTDQTTFNLINTTATTLNIGSAATTISIGSSGSTATTTFNRNVVVSGNLTVNGTTTTINTSELSVDDINITLGDTASPTNTTANGGGITLRGTTDKTFNWINATGSWTSSENIELATGKVYRIDGVDVLSRTGLGSSVVSSSLTSVGTLTGLTVSGNTNINNISIASGTSTVTTTGSNNLVLTPGGKTTTTKDFDVSATLNVNGVLNVDNIRIDGNVISSTNTNGNITLTPNGSGIVETLADVSFGTLSDLSTVNIVGQLNADNLRLDGNTVSSTTGNITLSSAGGSISTSNTVNITSTLNVTGLLNVDNLRLDGNTLNSTTGDLTINSPSTNSVIIGSETGGASITCNDSNTYTVGSGSTPSSAPIILQKSVAARGSFVVDGDIIVRGNFTQSGGTSGESGTTATFIEFNGGSAINGREITLTSTNSSTVYNLDDTSAAAGGTYNPSFGVKYVISVTRNSDSRRMIFEMLATWDGAVTYNNQNPGEIHTTEYGIVNPNNLPYTFDVQWVQTPSLGTRATLRVTNVPVNESITVRMGKIILI